MARRITTISLDDEAYEQAKLVGNLSQFVRLALQEESNKLANVPVDYHNNFREHLNICYPYHPSGYCGICWPNGRPTKNQFRDWNISFQQALRAGKNPPAPPLREPDRRKLTSTARI